MKIWKFKLEHERTQIVKMPLKSEIMDIQMQEDVITMWALCDPDTKEIEVKINMYGTGWETHSNNMIKDDYLATVQQGGLVWHFFMNHEIDL